MGGLCGECVGSGEYGVWVVRVGSVVCVGGEGGEWVSVVCGGGW